MKKNNIEGGDCIKTGVGCSSVCWFKRGRGLDKKEEDGVFEGQGGGGLKPQCRLWNWEIPGCHLLLHRFNSCLLL